MGGIAVLIFRMNKKITFLIQNVIEFQIFQSYNIIIKWKTKISAHFLFSGLWLCNGDER